MVAVGNKGTTNQRDQRIITDLYLAPCLLTEQVAKLHFRADGEPSCRAAERKLYRLAAKDRVGSSSVDTPEGNRRKVWTLDKELWHAEHRDIADGSQRSAAMVAPRPGRLEHFITANDLYTESAPTLREYFGEPGGDGTDGWTWRHEYKCEHTVSLGGVDKKVKPDGELTILDTTMYLETQTTRSHATVERMKDKVEAYAMYFKHVLNDNDDLHQLLVLTDESEIASSVEAKGRDLGVMVVGGKLEKLAEHIRGTALRLS